MDKALPNPQSYYAGGKAIIYDPVTRTFSDSPNNSVGAVGTPTVLSDANVRESIIPAINTAVNNLPSSNRTYVAQDGNTYDEATGKIVSSGSAGDNTDISAILKSYGDNYDTSVANDPYEKQFNDLITSMRGSNDAELQTGLSALKARYDVKNANLVETQKSQSAGIENALLLGGGERYAPVSSSGVLSAKQRYDMQTLGELQAQQDAAEAALKSAHTAKEYQIAQTQLANVDKIRTQKMATLKTVSESLSKDINTQKTNALQAARDSAVADLVSKGTTDSTDIIKALNFDSSGKVTGANYTAKEISDTLTNIAKNVGLTDMKSLTGEVRNFAILKQNSALPDGIDSLPENQQLGAYLKFIKPGKILGVTSPSSKVSLDEATKKGWPQSTVGMTESDIINSFQSETPPKWFIEKLQGQEKQSLLPQFIQTQWDSFKKTNAPAPTDSSKKTTTKSTARTI